MNFGSLMAPMMAAPAIRRKRAPGIFSQSDKQLFALAKSYGLPVPPRPVLTGQSKGRAALRRIGQPIANGLKRA
ncbi:MAG: hypothetical protein JJT95_03910 [Pararhodobacter sp.]|nr:hypothetical protein [Pararhodobacter sp.]